MQQLIQQIAFFFPNDHPCFMTPGTRGAAGSLLLVDEWDDEADGIGGEAISGRTNLPINITFCKFFIAKINERLMFIVGTGIRGGSELDSMRMPLTNEN